MRSVTRFLLVCAGGAIGSGARYLVVLWAARALGTAAPWGTLVVNILGSFAMGFLMELAMRPAGMASETRLFLATGVLGGFTTYSAFNFETTSLLRMGAWAGAALNLIATICGCLAAGAAGLAAARTLIR
jgi:CrcB protein